MRIQPFSVPLPLPSENTLLGKQALSLRQCTGVPGKPSAVEVVWKSLFSDAVKQELIHVSTAEDCLVGIFFKKKGRKFLSFFASNFHGNKVSSKNSVPKHEYFIQKVKDFL